MLMCFAGKDATVAFEDRTEGLCVCKGADCWLLCMIMHRVPNQANPLHDHAKGLHDWHFWLA